MNKYLLIGGTVLTVLSLIAIGILTGFYVSRDKSKLPNDYAIVFDAGSSGSRMYIYTWKSGFSAAAGDPLIVEQFDSLKADDSGIDKIKSKEELISKFKNCMARAEEKIPADRRNRTYLFLAATAGMRLLNAKNETASEQIFDYIRDYFSQSKFLFKNASQARIITGQEEGSNAWISANYFLNKFKPNADPADTVGSMDLGGASTQMVYVPDSTKISNEDNSKFFQNIRIYGINYKPYSHSFLCYGINEVGLLYKSYALRLSSFNTSSIGSCYPKNSVVTINSDNLLNSPCSNGIIMKYNFTVNTSNIDSNKNFDLKGISSFDACMSEVNVITPKPACNYSKCSFDGVYQPSLENREFAAFSNFFYAINNTEALFNIKLSGDILELENVTKQMCLLSLKQLQDLNIKNNAGIKDSFLINMCFANNYIITLFKNYGFKDLKQVTISEKINGYSVGWTLGYLINELNRDDFLPYEVPPRRLSLQYFAPLVAIAAILALVLIIFQTFYIVRNRQSSYDKGIRHYVNTNDI